MLVGWQAGVRWAMIVLDGPPSCFDGPPFSCRVRAGTACRDRGTGTAHPPCHVSTDTTSIVLCRVRVVFLSVVRRAARRVCGPSGHL
jgi:hypothetical protein